MQGKRITPQGVELFSILSLLPDGIHRESLEPLAPGYGNEGARSLVANGLASYTDQRLQMLAPIRSFGEEHYPPAEGPLTHVVDFFCTLAESGDEIGREKGAEVAERISQELGNIEKMITRALSLSPEKGIKAALGLSEFSLFTGLANRALLREAYHKAQEIGASALEANCVRSLGKIAFLESDNEQARQLFNQALPLYEQIGSLLGKANCLWSIGDIQKAEGHPSKAKASWEQALMMYKRIGDLYSMRVMYSKLASVTEGKEKEEFQKMEQELKDRLENR